MVVHERHQTTPTSAIKPKRHPVSKTSGSQTSSAITRPSISLRESESPITPHPGGSLCSSPPLLLLSHRRHGNRRRRHHHSTSCAAEDEEEAETPLPPRVPHQRGDNAEAGDRQVARVHHLPLRPRLPRRPFPVRGQVRRRGHLPSSLLRVVPVRQGVHGVQEFRCMPQVHRGPDRRTGSVRWAHGLLSGRDSVRGVARDASEGSCACESAEDQVRGDHRRCQVRVAGGGGGGVFREDSVPFPPFHRLVFLVILSTEQG